MSHGKIRTEKICLNCGTETTGRFCPACGQQNVEPKQSVWHLIQHFFSDITHFDGKFFETVKDLFAKPGFLSKEYMMGRRASYLDPIRMYIFTSAFFFLVFFSLFSVKDIHIGDKAREEVKNDPDLSKMLSGVKTARDSLRIMKAYNQLQTPFIVVSDSAAKKPKGIEVLRDDRYHTVGAYDSAQKALPVAERDGWLNRRLKIRVIELGERYQKDRGELFREMIGNFMHNFPKMLFISLPLFALLLKLLYVRRKSFYYVDHGIFSIHLYIFSFLMLLVIFALNGLQNKTGWHWLQWIMLVAVVYPFVYYFKAMRRFYGQSRAKTFLKYMLLFLLAFIVQILIFVGAALFTVFET